MARFNACVSTDSDYVYRGRLVHVRPHLVLGMVRGGLSMSHAAGFWSGRDKNVSFDPSVGVVAGGAVAARQARNQGRWAAHGELAWQWNKFERGPNDRAGSRLGAMSVEYHRLRLALLARRYFVASRLQPFVEAGSSGGLLLQFDSEKHERTASGEIVPDGAVVEEPRHHIQSLIVGTGMSYGRLEVALRYEVSTGFSAIKALSVEPRYVHMVMGYRL